MGGKMIEPDYDYTCFGFTYWSFGTKDVHLLCVMDDFGNAVEVFDMYGFYAARRGVH
jgi:hypothetical protein